MLKIRYGMVGGDVHAFIGEVHRKALNFDVRTTLVAGCFSNIPEYNIETAQQYNVSDERTYKDYIEMAQAESKREDGINFVSICTPNFLHYEVAKKFLSVGINVVCEKPLCFKVEEAQELVDLAKSKGLIFAVTYAYTGYTMVKIAKELISSGKIGNILNINAEYLQEWLIDEIGASNGNTAKLSIWRKDPKFSGISNCVGDIGTHMENMIHYLTGFEIKRVSALLDNFGQALDLNGNILVEYTNGVRGNYFCSQIAVGHLNGFKVRIFGDKGAIEWEQENPDQLNLTLKGEATQILKRGTGYLGDNAAKTSRIPSGHPEGYHIAFANTYRNIVSAIAKQMQGIALEQNDLDYPKGTDGLAGVKFIKAVVDSNNNDAKWVDIK